MYDYIEVYTDIFNSRGIYKGARLALHNVAAFEFIKNNEDEINSVVDIGTGRGAYIAKMRELIPREIRVVTTDLKQFHKLDDVEFVKLDLSSEQELEAFKDNEFDLLTCLGVLEHIEAKYIDSILEMFASVSRFSIFTIANHSDKFKEFELHLIQERIEWWQEKIEKYYNILKAAKIGPGARKGRLFLFELESKLYGD
jgi:ubiquinone/menaquinone biosynthesis C-methylase UbiE